MLFFIWPLCCLFFFDIWILIAPLVSSNSSSTQVNICYVLSVVLFFLLCHIRIFSKVAFLYCLVLDLNIHNLMIRNAWDNIDLVYECAIVCKNKSNVDCDNCKENCNVGGFDNHLF